MPSTIPMWNIIRSRGKVLLEDFLSYLQKKVTVEVCDRWIKLIALNNVANKHYGGWNSMLVRVLIKSATVQIKIYIKWKHCFYLECRNRRWYLTNFECKYVMIIYSFSAFLVCFYVCMWVRVRVHVRACACAKENRKITLASSL